MPHSIRTLQTMLRAVSLGSGEIPPVLPDGVFGPQTEASVLAFQREAGLKATGAVDAETWGRLLEACSRLRPAASCPAPLLTGPEPGDGLRPGCADAHFYLAQAMIRALSEYYCNVPSVPCSGVCDRETERALRTLQHCGRLEETGALDRGTWRLLSELYACTVGSGINQPASGKK